MIAKSDDTAFPITAAVSEGGGVPGLTIEISLRDANATTFYLDFSDNVMKSSGWTSKTKTLTDYGGGFYGTQVNVFTISGLTDNHVSVEYDISGSSVGITNSLLTIENYGLSTSQALQFLEMYKRLNLDTDVDMTHAPDGGISGGAIDITTTTDVDGNVITHRE